mmetsp:Transcript_9890/g.27445  ORF Transcript_9890/g.27445 Transcript_9890/m.27445 type:complete len:104 (-) Transcript_9890:831-1142(-)
MLKQWCCFRLVNKFSKPQPDSMFEPNVEVVAVKPQFSAVHASFLSAENYSPKSQHIDDGDDDGAAVEDTEPLVHPPLLATLLDDVLLAVAAHKPHAQQHGLGP